MRPNHVQGQKPHLQTILIMLLWSGVGGQLLSHHVAVVKGWWFMLAVNCAHVL